MDDAKRQVIIDLERQFWNASTDPEFYRTCVADEAVFVLPFGTGIYSKADAIKQVSANQDPWINVRFSQEHLVEINGEAVMFTYQGTAVKAQAGTIYEALVTSVYRLEKGQLLLLLHQQTP